ncbi:MAG: glycosyltransferase family 4 protein [Prevotella sp.]|nr:glycosyltransferase family 4 protein [Prevotella sp.]
MKVLIVNTSEKTGGAAVAAHRLMDALNNHGVKARMLVRDKETDALTVVGLRGKWRQQWHFLWERLVIFLHLHCNRQRLFEIDIANAGTDITGLREFREADVIHLHWVNQGMLSLGVIGKILRSGKPVVWTMHDLWPATAICHYARGCKNYRTGCAHCRLLPGNGSANDLASRVWRRKQRMLDGQDISFVTCSQWLRGEARASALLQGHRVTSIPNAIDTRVYCPRDKQEARRTAGLPADRKVILFVSQRVTDERKGMNYLTEAVRLMVSDHPDMGQQAVIAILGGHSEGLADQLSLPVHPLGYVSDERQIVNIYRAADVFVTPSLEDNLPNTIMEAMACGVPCVGFKVGGIPEEIDHQKNGYVARYRDAADLARGIRWVLYDSAYATLSQQAVTKVAHSYSQQSVALRYTELYNETIAQKHYKL